MSLHVLANHMATKGRGSDSMLVHMTPAEVASLQALAMKNGGSLTINPDTGLPEAGFLKKLLPALAGFALNAFAPGFGTAIGGALGLSGAAGTAIGLGGITGLATGSLSKGLMAGLGAYGGASLAGSVMGAGAVGAGAGVGAGIPADMAFNLENAGLGTANADIAGKAIQGIQPSAFDKLGAGFKAVSDAPGAFLKDNWKMGLAAASPFIADAMVPTTTKMPAAPNTGYIRPYDYDPVGQTFKRIDPILASDLAAKPPPGMARGGIVALADGGETDPYARYNTLSGQSKAAYDYLMGNVPSSAAAAPVASVQPPATTPAPADTTTTTTTPATTTDPMKTQPVTGGGGGGGGASPIIGSVSVGNDPVPALPYQGDPYTEPYVPEPVQPEPVQPEPMPPDPYPYPEPEPQPEPVLPWEPPVFNEPVTPEPVMPAPVEPEPVLPWEPPPYEPEPDPNFFEPGYGNTGVPEPVPYQGDPYTEPYVPYQGDPYTEPYVPYVSDPYNPDPVYNAPYVPVETDVPEPADYEVQPWENVDNSGYYNGSMAGDNSLYSGNNTYTGTTSEPSAGLPDAFGSYPGEPTYIDDNGGAGSFGDRMIEAEGDYGFGDEDYYDYQGMARGGLTQRYALGGLGSLGGYSDGGRLLKGPGDGVSDSIPATIGNKKQPARLADGEFVVPARIVSELGNGSTEAGARKLYAMMDRIQKARGKTVGKGKVAANSRSEKHLPA